MDYAIVATLGPACRDAAAWEALLSAGASAFRLNTSHLSLEQLGAWLEGLDGFFSARCARAARVPLVLDLQGSKWRLGQFASLTLAEGQRVELVLAASTDRPNVLPVPHADFFKAAALFGGEIVLNDARVRLAVESSGAERLAARVVQAGELSAHKGLTLAHTELRIEALSDKDRAILERTRGLESVRYAISYVKDAAEAARYRALCGPSVSLIAKIERRPAIDEAAEIAASVDELWLCRGDLGAELGLPAMAEAVRRFAELPGKLPVPVLMAGQVLEHMTRHATPTRSEVCYLYDCLRAGYRGVVLSDETAVGRYPVESCRAAAMFRKRRAG